jgi:hypothetical protein
MKKNKVIFYPDDRIYKYLYNDSNIYYFNNFGWWFFDGKSRVNIEISQISYKSSNYNITKLISDLRFWGPMWSRMIGCGDMQELTYRKTALLIYAISGDLKKFNIKTAYFMTSVTHHVDSLIFDLACSLNKINKIFMYREVIAARLVPFVQKNDIPSRTFLNKSISKYRYNEALNAFISNKNKNLPPKTNYEHKRYSSFLFAFFICFFKDCRFIFSMLKSFFKPSNKNIFNFIYKTYPFQFTSQLVRAKLAFDFYIKEQMTNQQILLDQKKYGPVLLISANFQPEATSFPEGWQFSNHIDLVLELRRKGYDKKIFYKEHPDSFFYIIGKGPTCAGIFRSVDYYKQLLALGCILVPRDFNLSVDSGQNINYLPVTISGSIGLERALFGFHTIVAGYPWYQKNLPGILSLDSIKSLKKIKNEWLKFNDRNAKNAYKFMLDNLNNKTVVNAAGIGDSPVNNLIIKSYLREFRKLISAS